MPTPQIQLRQQAGTTGPSDVTLSVQDKTFEYLQTSNAPEIRISGYLDRDWPIVESQYAEVSVAGGRLFQVLQITPGSKTRKITLPGAMKTGEQLVIRVKGLTEPAVDV